MGSKQKIDSSKEKRRKKIEFEDRNRENLISGW